MAYRSIDPNTGEVIKTYDNHSDAELANALTAADGVYRSEWSRGPIERRLDVLSRLADRIAERGEELARIVVREMGKRIAEARREVALIAEIARYYAENAAAFLGAFFEPTILTGISRDNPAYFAEFFGPVAQIYVVRDDDQAVALANDSHYGLSGSIFSRDVGRAKALASRIDTGSVWINTSSSTAPELPFGGVKRSGYGRELSEYGLKELVNQKMVLVSYPDKSET